MVLSTCKGCPHCLEHFEVFPYEENPSAKTLAERAAKIVHAILSVEPLELSTPSIDRFKISYLLEAVSRFHSTHVKAAAVWRHTHPEGTDDCLMACLEAIRYPQNPTITLAEDPAAITTAHYIKPKSAPDRTSLFLRYLELIEEGSPLVPLEILRAYNLNPKTDLNTPPIPFNEVASSLIDLWGQPKANDSLILVLHPAPEDKKTHLLHSMTIQLRKFSLFDPKIDKFLFFTNIVSFVTGLIAYRESYYPELTHAVITELSVK